MNDYLDAIRQAVFLFPIPAAGFALCYGAYSVRRWGAVRWTRLAAVESFLLYLMCVYCLVILPLPTTEEAAALHGHEAQLIPFAFVGDILREGEGSWLAGLTSPAALTMLLNLMMTAPFGVYLRGIFRQSWRATVGYTFLLSLFLELTQLTGLYFLYPGSYRMFDVDDLLINTAGGLAGYGLGGLALEVLAALNRLTLGRTLGHRLGAAAARGRAA